jgi:hypothetical protein
MRQLRGWGGALFANIGKCLGIVVEKQIPQIIATLLQNYLLNNFASSIPSVILPNAAIAGLQEHGG